MNDIGTPNPLVENSVCNDETNDENCDYDGGDCCLLSRNDEHCSECDCHHQETCAAGFLHGWVGDGYCHDETNNPDCNYDGGDWCGPCVVTQFCSECECRGNVTGNGISSPSVGDGICNDETNNGECNYDGGDCCWNVNTDYCSVCMCHNPECVPGVNDLVGDGYCNDETNIGDCHFDGGDCCRTVSSVNTSYCTECTCNSK